MDNVKNKGEAVNVEHLPSHTRKEVILGMVQDAIRKKGGLTINTKLQKPPKKGYIVGTGEFEKDLNGATRVQIEDLINEVFVSLDEKGCENLYIGLWVNPLTFEAVFEVSMHLNSLQMAIFLGKQGDQYSIFDLENGKDIVLDH